MDKSQDFEDALNPTGSGQTMAERSVAQQPIFDDALNPDGAGQTMAERSAAQQPIFDAELNPDGAGQTMAERSATQKSLFEAELPDGSTEDKAARKAAEIADGLSGPENPGQKEVSSLPPDVLANARAAGAKAQNADGAGTFAKSAQPAQHIR